MSISRNYTSGDGRPAGSLLELLGSSFSLLLALMIVSALALSACSRKPKTSKAPKFSKRVVQMGQPVPKGGGRYKVGNPYQIAGRWYTPKEQPNYNKVGVASWYGELFHGRYTANGEVFDMNALTAAHPTLPMPSYVRVTNLGNGRSLVLRVNDRGPYAHDRIIDLSRKSAQALGFERRGTQDVRVQYLGRAPLNGDDSLEKRHYASQPWARQYTSLNKPARTSSRVELAAAVKQEIEADPMVVAAIPKQPGNGDGWTTSLRHARGKGVEKGSSPHFIQAASFTNRVYAEGLREKLSGYADTKVMPTTIAGKTWYRVRLGPFDDRHDADETLRIVVTEGVSDARIVRN